MCQASYLQLSTIFAKIILKATVFHLHLVDRVKSHIAILTVYMSEVYYKAH